MKNDLGDVPFVGFVAHEFDFPALHGRVGQMARDLLDAMIEAAIDAEADPSLGKFCYFLIVGHSDRQDSPNMTGEQRRADELEYSTLRAESAQSFVFEEIFNRMTAAGMTAPIDIANLKAVEMRTVACGSADLINKTPGNDEALRAENRRVHISCVSVTP